MAVEAKKEKSVHALTIDEAFKTSKEDWRWVNIPKLNAQAKPYDAINLNHHKFDAGKKHHLPATIADEVEAHMERYNRQILLLNSSERDLAALNQIGDQGYDPRGRS